MFALVCHVPFLLGPVKSGGADADRALNTALRIRFSTGLAGEPFLVAQPRMNDGLVSVSYDRSAERKILRRYGQPHHDGPHRRTPPLVEADGSVARGEPIAVDHMHEAVGKKVGASA